MSNLIRTTTDFARYIATHYISPGDVLVDATCGNGHDTLWLAKSAPSALYAFDMQPRAISSTRERLLANGFDKQLEDGTITLICDSHERMSQYIANQVNVIVFNLGYLPHGDKHLVTKSSSTVSAVVSSINLLAEDGLICITMYSGHPEGAEEKASLLKFAGELDPQLYHTAYISMTNQPNEPPEILLITKKRRKKSKK